jgi:UDP-N-acetyl-D-glucosamine dehydrogenase
VSVAVAAARAKHVVYGLDIDKVLITELNDGLHPMPGITRSQIINLIEAKNYVPTYDPACISISDVIVIAVPTPLYDNRLPNLEYLKSACEMIADFISSGTLVVNESTSHPGTLRNFIKPIIERGDLLEIDYAAAPERVDPANSSWNIENTPRVISGLSEHSSQRAIDFYSSFCEQVTKVSSPEVAEASKVFENTFRQVNIALSNEFAQIASNLGFSANEAINAAGTKPFGFMSFYPGIGVGGHCIPIDPIYLSQAAKQFGIDAKLINLASLINTSAPVNVANKIKDYMGGSLRNIRIQIAGISYKPNVADTRESPAIVLIDELVNLGALVSWCDPLVREFKNMKSINLDTAIDLGLIVTPHDEIDFSIWRSAKTQVLDLSPNNKNFGWSKFF